METIQLGDLTAALDRRTAGTLTLHLSGRSGSREAGKEIAPLLDRALAEAAEGSLALAIHFEELAYFNSSTIAALVQFIRAVRGRAVGLTVVYDPGQRWQALSFDALQRALRPFEGGAGPAVRFRER